jgi:hypothetical protein
VARRRGEADVSALASREEAVVQESHRGRPLPTASDRESQCQAVSRLCWWLSDKAGRENPQRACGGARESRRARRARDGLPVCDRRDGRFRNPPLQAIQRASRGFSRQPRCVAAASSSPGETADRRPTREPEASPPRSCFCLNAIARLRSFGPLAALFLIVQTSSRVVAALATAAQTERGPDRRPPTADFKGRDARRASPGSRRDAPSRPPSVGRVRSPVARSAPLRRSRRSARNRLD